MPQKTPHELWVAAMKSGVTGSLGNSGQRVDCYSNKTKRPPSRDVAYLSTSHFLRQTVGAEKLRNGTDARPMSSAGTPIYKSQEEYYDEILDLKRQIVSMKNENDSFKTKNRRLEEELLKKDKELESLFQGGGNFTGSARGSRSRGAVPTDPNASGMQLQNMKQRVMKLEYQLRQKQQQMDRLESSLKSTQTEELRLQCEVYFEEISRLRSIIQSGGDPSKVGISGSSARTKSSSGGAGGMGAPREAVAAKIRALNETIIRLNDSNVQLQADNKHLKEELDSLETDRSRLLKGVQQGGGGVDEKLANKLQNQVKKFREEVGHCREKIAEQNEEIKQLRHRNRELEAEMTVMSQQTTEPVAPGSSRSSKSARSPRDETASARRQRERRESSASNKSRRSSRADRQLGGEEAVERKRQVDDFRQNHSARVIQRGWRDHRSRQEKHAMESEDEQRRDDFRKKHAAKTIQNGFRLRRQRDDDAISEVQAIMKGNRTRKMFLKVDGDNNDSTVDEEDSDESLTYVQSAARGHLKRKDIFKQYEKESEEEEENEAITNIQAAFRGQQSRHNQIRSFGRSTTATTSGRRRSSVKFQKVVEEDEDADDDDDVCF